LCVERSWRKERKFWRPEKGKLTCVKRSLEPRNEALETGRKKALVSEKKPGCLVRRL
jgi:hypothetical protein